MSTINRRYDIDWVRVIAIGLLILYHAAIGFQPWGIMISFITNEKPWNALWAPMAILNVWRIPLLFFVSGMGVYFAMQKRTWGQLLGERAGRIFVPFVFGTFCIFPISQYLWQTYYQWDVSYNPHPGHLWFLGNIFSYVVLWSPIFFYLKKNEDGKLVTAIKWLLSSPLGLLLVLATFVAEALLVKPNPYEMYSMTWHGFFLGLGAFFWGFCFILSGSKFWEMLLKWRWMLLITAVILFTIRLVQLELKAPAYLIAIESNFWIFSVLAFGYRYLNHPSKALSYLSHAAYPIYIIHMIFQYAGSRLIFPLDINVQLKFVLLLIFTYAGCFLSYEFLIRRVKFIRPLFGLKINEDNKPLGTELKAGALS